MESVAFKDIRMHFTKIANEVQFRKKHYVLTKNNKPSVAIVSVKEAQLLERLQEHLDDLEDLKLYQQRKKAKKISIEEIWKELNVSD